MTNITCSRVTCIYNDESEKYRGECQRTEVKLVSTTISTVEETPSGRLNVSRELLDCRVFEGVDDGKLAD